MQYTHDIKQAKQFADLAMKKIAEEKLSRTPDIFELWYVYYSGQSSEVRRAIDILAQNKKPVMDADCREIYQRFLSNAQSEEVVRRVGTEINTTIQNVSGAVKDVRTATAAYSGRLDDVSGQMEGVQDPGELRNILSNVVMDTHAMLEQNKKLEEQLDQSSSIMETLQRDLENVRREALTDGLTGLANRKAFDNELKRVSEKAVTEGIPFTLIMLDIDHFKNFNDNYGHQIGDQVLRLVARTLIDGVKGRDVAARYGGEEFAIILPDTGLQNGVTVAEGLRRAVATKDVVNRTTSEKLANITLSAGVAEFSANERVEDLIERADAALYTAKHNGRNQVAAAPTPGKKSERKKKA